MISIIICYYYYYYYYITSIYFNLYALYKTNMDYTGAHCLVDNLRFVLLFNEILCVHCVECKSYWSCHDNFFQCDWLD